MRYTLLALLGVVRPVMPFAGVGARAASSLVTMMAEPPPSMPAPRIVFAKLTTPLRIETDLASGRSEDEFSWSRTMARLLSSTGICGNEIANVTTEEDKANMRAALHEVAEAPASRRERVGRHSPLAQRSK